MSEHKKARGPRYRTQPRGEELRRVAARRTAGLTYRTFPGSNRRKARSLGVHPSQITRRQNGQHDSPLSRATEEAAKMGETAAMMALSHLMAAGMGERLKGKCPESVRQGLIWVSTQECGEQPDLKKMQAFLHAGGLVCLQTMLKEATEAAAPLLNLIAHLQFLVAQEADG